MPSIDDVRRFLTEEHGLVVVSTVQGDGRVLSSVVNAGVMDHPLTGVPVVAFVSAGRAARNGHIRRGSEVTVVARRGWRWVGVTGPATLIGPDEPADGASRADIDGEQVRVLLREVFEAAGGTHDDWDEYDRVMATERRVAVFVAADRIIGNG